MITHSFCLHLERSNLKIRPPHMLRRACSGKAHRVKRLVQPARDGTRREPPTYRASGSQTSTPQRHNSVPRPEARWTTPHHYNPPSASPFSHTPTHTLHQVEPDCGTVWISTSNARKGKANTTFRRLRCNKHQRPHFQSNCESELII